MNQHQIIYKEYNPVYVEKNMDDYVRSKMSSESFITPLRPMPNNKDEKIITQINYLEQRIYSPPPKESYQIPTPKIFPNQKQPQNYFLDPPLVNQLPLKYYPPTYSNVIDYSKNRPKDYFPDYEPNYYPQPIDNAIGDYNFVNQQNYNLNNNNYYNDNYSNYNMKEVSNFENNNINNYSGNVHFNVVGNGKGNLSNNIDLKSGYYQQKMDDFSIKSKNDPRNFNQGKFNQGGMFEEYQRKAFNY